MGTFLTSGIQSGDVYFVRDNAYFAWLTKWKTAGWAYRDDMNIPTHMGFLWKNTSTLEAYFIETDTVYNTVRVNPISKRTNQPGDCPGILAVWRPKAWRYGLYNSQSYALSSADQAYFRAYYAAQAQAQLPTYVNQGTYDILALFGLLFGTTWNSEASWLCSEFCYFFLRKYFWTAFPFIKCRYGRMYDGLNIWMVADDAAFSISYHCAFYPASSSMWQYFIDGPAKYWLVMNNNPSPYEFKTCYADQGNRTPGFAYTIVSKYLWWRV